MLSALSAKQRSSPNPVMRLYFTPASGLNSNVVTTGPGLICVTWPCTSNSAHFSVSVCARTFNSSSSTACWASGRVSKLLGGNLNVPAARGITVFAFKPTSARVVTSGSAELAADAVPTAAGSSSNMRSMPVRFGVATDPSAEYSGTLGAIAGSGSSCFAGTSFAVTVGFSARRRANSS